MAHKSPHHLPHPLPQAPAVAKARMYKVLKEIVEENQSGTSGSSNVACLCLGAVLWVLGLCLLGLS